MNGSHFLTRQRRVQAVGILSRINLHTALITSHQLPIHGLGGNTYLPSATSMTAK